MSFKKMVIRMFQELSENYKEFSENYNRWKRK